MVVFSKKPVHSILYLVFCFFTIGGHYLLLNAQFLFIVHIIVYAGAIMVLFLFTIMFINMNNDAEPHKHNYMKIAATLAAGSLLLVLTAATKGAEQLATPSSNTQIGNVENLGKVLYGQYMLPFEITSILLLTAMVGAVMLGKKSVQ